MPRILVVDDDKSVLHAMRVLLELDGHEVVVASSGRDAIQAISSSSFDVAIVDISVRGAGGLETIKALNQHASDIPVIAVSAFLFRDPSAPVLDLPAISPALGAARMLQKPFRPRDLVNAIVVCLDSHHGLGAHLH